MDPGHKNSSSFEILKDCLKDCLPNEPIFSNACNNSLPTDSAEVCIAAQILFEKGLFII